VKHIGKPSTMRDTILRLFMEVSITDCGVVVVHQTSLSGLFFNCNFLLVIMDSGFLNFLALVPYRQVYDPLTIYNSGS
jgi:hypothetical protein